MPTSHHSGTWSGARVAEIASAPEEAARIARETVLEALALHTPVFGDTRAAYVETLRSADAPERKRLPAHFTTSCFVLHPARDALLLLHHRKYREWVHPGGHADGDWFLLRSALRECEEETGFAELLLLQDENAMRALPGSLACGARMLPRAALLPLFVQAFTIPAFPDLGAHTHYDHVYRFRAQAEEVRIAAAESLGSRWVEASWFQKLVESGEEAREGVTRLTAQVCLRAFT